MSPASAGGDHVETTSMPCVPVEKSLTKNRKNERLPAEVMPSDRSSVRSSGVRVRMLDSESRSSMSTRK